MGVCPRLYSFTAYDVFGNRVTDKRLAKERTLVARELAITSIYMLSKGISTMVKSFAEGKIARLCPRMLLGDKYLKNDSSSLGR